MVFLKKTSFAQQKAINNMLMRQLVKWCRASNGITFDLQRKHFYFFSSMAIKITQNNQNDGLKILLGHLAMEQKNKVHQTSSSSPHICETVEHPIAIPLLEIPYETVFQVQCPLLLQMENCVQEQLCLLEYVVVLLKSRQPLCHPKQKEI